MSLLTDIAKQRSIQVPRRIVANRFAPCPKHAGESGKPAGLALHSAPGPARSPLPEASQPTDACPIWFAALMATSCLAGANGENRAIGWECVSGRAVYTNRGGDAERIEPLGVSLMGGQTLAVYWMPGETAYTVEVYRKNEKCA